MITARQTALKTLHLYKGNFSIQQYKTLKGQIYAGDIPGFYRGIDRLLGKTGVLNCSNNKKGVNYGEKKEKEFKIAGKSKLQGVLLQCPVCNSVFKAGRESCFQCRKKVDINVVD